MKPLRNSTTDYGWLSRALHWLMATALILMLWLGLRITNMEPSLSNLWLYGIHKSIGFCLLILTLLRLIWHRVSPPPSILTENITRQQHRLANWVHISLYLSMLAIPLTGLIASSATGIDTNIFGLITLPSIAPVSESWERLFFFAHDVITKLFMGLLALHFAGALHRHFIKRDRTLTRMIGSQRSD